MLRILVRLIAGIIAVALIAYLIAWLCDVDLWEATMHSF